MAAVKLHLKNNNKDYKLKATDRKTDAGKIIYKNTLTGELHSELSMTLEMPEGSGNWINVPSLINGRVYNQQGVIDMLNAGKVEPTSTGHLTQDAAVQAAIYRSNNLQQLPATKEDIIGANIKPNQVVSLSDAVNNWNSSEVHDVKNYEWPTEFEVDIRDEDMMRKFDNATQYSRSSFQNLPDFSKIENSMYDLRGGGAGRGDIVENPRERGMYTAMAPYELRTGPESDVLTPIEARDRAMSSYEPRPTEALNAAELARQQAAIGQAMSAYGPRTGQSPIPEGAVLTYADGRVYNGAVQMINGQPADAAGQKLIVNDAGTVPVDDTNQAMLAKAAEEQALHKVYADSEEAARQKAIAADRKADLARIQENLGPIIAQVEEAKERAKTKAFPGREDARFDANGGYLNTPTDDGIFNYKGLKLNPANQPVAADEQIYGGGNYNLQPNDDGPFYYGDVPGKSKIRDDGSFYYGDVAGKSRIRDDGSFDYGKDDNINPKFLRPNQKQIVREVVNVPKGTLKPDYGEMPGFKFNQAKGQKSGQGYWDVDEKSDFWQTDAGYDKALQTWGQKPGWVKPGYRPKKKELDIEAIKKWFTPSK